MFLILHQIFRIQIENTQTTLTSGSLRTLIFKDTWKRITNIYNSESYKKKVLMGDLKMIFITKILIFVGELMHPLASLSKPHHP